MNPEKTPRTTIKIQVTGVYQNGKLESIIHYDRKEARAELYLCEPMDEDSIAERIGTAEPLTGKLELKAK